jgi:hemolysin III
VSASSPSSATSSIIRPRLRGVADYYATAVAIPAVVLLIAAARPGAPTTAVAVYGVCLVVLLIGSTLYHMPHWPVRTLLWLQRIDHANIYLMIAGTCTPLGLSLMPGPGGWLLVAMWVAAGWASSSVWCGPAGRGASTPASMCSWGC